MANTNANGGRTYGTKGGAYVMACPACGATMNRLEGADGYEAVSTVAADSGCHYEAKKLRVVHACPSCEVVL